MWYISIILIILAGICNAIMDALRTRYNKSIFRDFRNQLWIDPALSWPNKWKNGDRSQGERFFGSSTFLVWLTDLWHLAKFLMLLFITFSIALYDPIIVWWIDWFILYCAFTIPFEIFYSKVLIKS
jgi:hypothetical protein